MRRRTDVAAPTFCQRTGVRPHSRSSATALRSCPRYAGLLLDLDFGRDRPVRHQRATLDPATDDLRYLPVARHANPGRPERDAQKHLPACMRLGPPG